MSLNKFKKIEIIPSIFSEHNAVELEINPKRKKIGKKYIHVVYTMLVNNECIEGELQEDRQKLHGNI